VLVIFWNNYNDARNNECKKVEIVCAKIQIFWRIHILAKRTHLLSHVCTSDSLSALMSSHFTDFHKILFLSLLLKYVEKIQKIAVIWKISGTVYEDLSKSYCCRRRKIAIEATFSSEVVSGCYEFRGGKKLRERATTWHTCIFSLQKQIVYYAVEHNYHLFRSSYFFRLFRTVIGSRTQYLKKKVKCNLYIFITCFHFVGSHNFTVFITIYSFKISSYSADGCKSIADLGKMCGDEINMLNCKVVLLNY